MIFYLAATSFLPLTLFRLKIRKHLTGKQIWYLVNRVINFLSTNTNQYFDFSFIWPSEIFYSAGQCTKIRFWMIGEMVQVEEGKEINPSHAD